MSVVIVNSVDAAFGCVILKDDRLPLQAFDSRLVLQILIYIASHLITVNPRRMRNTTGPTTPCGIQTFNVLNDDAFTIRPTFRHVTQNCTGFFHL